VRVGVDSYSYHRLLGDLRPGEAAVAERLPDGAVAVIEEALGLGLDAVSLETCYLGPPHRFDIEALTTAAAGLEVVLAWGAPNGLEYGRNARALDDLLDWIDVAAVVGADTLRIVVAGPALRTRSNEWPGAVQPLRTAAARARACGLSLALENHGDISSLQLEAILDAVADETLGVCFDTANALRVGDDVAAAARRLAPGIRMLHLKDVAAPTATTDPVAGPPSVAYGEGVIPLAETLAAVGGRSFDGLVCVELGQLEVGADERSLIGRCLDWLDSYRQVGAST
jgi:sugar phosphate isomerase/epimerase